MPEIEATKYDPLEERDSVIQSISRQWQGNFASYLSALERAQQAAKSPSAGEQREDEVPVQAVVTARLVKRR